MLRMMRLVPLVYVLAVAGCASPPSTAWDPQAAEAVKQMAVDVLRDIDAGDFEGMLADADSNIVIMDFDDKNVPIRMNGMSEARAFMGQMDEMAKTQSLKFASTMVRNDAWATAHMGYGIVEYDQTITVGGQTMGPFKYRGTLVAQKQGEQWKMLHWHGAFREMPPPMPDPAAK